ncbi:hypothetical protein A9Q83_04950 [Alphaproteobacteria bacterium 46_93_T64]|nr:hypothetical protein A9Q83_04950 [Alphaproteobacteria bacterium 46_93_T64]
MRKALIPLLSIGMLSLSQLLATTAFSMDNLQMKHSVYLGGFFMGSLTTEMEQSATTYTVRSTVETNKTLRWLVSWTAKGATTGKLSGTQVQPVQHTHVSQWKDKGRGADIKYTPTGHVTYSTSGKKSNNPNKYTELDPASVHKSLDPMSMILAATLEFEKTGVCGGTYPIFDGRRRFDILLSDGGYRTFKKSDYSVFKGKASGCKFEVVEKGGFKKNKEYELKDSSDLVVWVASPTSGGRVVPVRMEVNTGFGYFELHLERYQYGAVKLASKNAQ